VKLDMTNLYQHKSGVWLRKDTHDKYVVGQISQYKTLNIKPGCRVLDLGGHIGLFAKYAADNDADYVLSIEPHPGNCDVFELNIHPYNCINLIEAAVVSRNCKDKTITFYESTTDTSAHSLVPTRGRNKLEVDTIQFSTVMKEAKPSIVKIDIEGYEFELFDEILELFPQYKVRSFAIEFHLNPKDFRQRARAFVKELDKLYKPIRVANITDKVWNATGVWVCNASS
jgi:FkbM family methyltransferase